MRAEVVSIHIAPEAGAPMQAVTEIEAVAGKGLRGDRYFSQHGTYSGKHDLSRQVTLIEMEALEALARDYRISLLPIESRRNIATRGVALNHLVGKRFRVGEALLLGMELCEPCGYLEQKSGKPVRLGLIHRGGLRAQILESGRIRVGDPIEVLEA
jgi:MOSC domain-containing protein YiiM